LELELKSGGNERHAHALRSEPRPSSVQMRLGTYQMEKRVSVTCLRVLVFVVFVSLVRGVLQRSCKGGTLDLREGWNVDLYMVT